MSASTPGVGLNKLVATSRSFTFGAFTLVPERQLLLRDGKAVRIGGRALDILTALVERPGDLVTKSELLAQVWPDTKVDESNLKVHMVALRRVLEEGADAPPCIATVVGQGYRFALPVQLAGASELPVEPSAPTSANHNLPSATTRIFGRAESIATIRRDLEQSRLVSIVGAGGIGKTTVAVAVAESALEAFGEGVWLVDLTPVQDAGRTPNAIAEALSLQGHSSDMLAVLCEFLRDRQTLLVLDNCEHIIAGVAACADRILASATGVRILVTSREPLRLAKERVTKLPGLDAPLESSSLDARAALDFAAVQLFVERAIEGHEDFQLSDVDAPVVGEICRKLDGLALAIELAAKRVGTFGVSGLLRQLDDRLRLLSGRRAGPERQRTLVATLDWSYGLLEEREAALLRAVSVFAGAFDLDGARSVYDAGSVEVLDTLASLSTKSLLAVEPQANGFTCRLLETTRAYAVGRLQNSGEEPAVRMRHAEYVCGVLDQAKAEWARRPAREWGAAYAHVVDDLRVALAWAVSDAAQRALLIRLTLAGTLLWNHLSLTVECRTHVSRALAELEQAGLVGTPTEMQFQMSLAGATMFTRGLIPEVLTALRRTLEIAERIGDVDLRLRGLRALGTYYGFSGQLESQSAALERFLAVAAEHDPSASPDGETHLGISELHLGRLQSARRRLERLHQRSALGFDGSRLARFLYDRIVDVGNVLSYAQWLTGSPDSAAQTAEATVKHALSVKHGLSLSNGLAVAACPVFFMSRRYEECSHYAAMLDEQVRQHGIVIWSPSARFYRGALACARAEVPAHGIEDLEQAVEEFRAINHYVRMPWTLAVLADALARGGRLADASTTVQDAVDCGRSLSERWCMPEVLRIQASILHAQGRSSAAEQVLGDAIDLARSIGGLSWRLRAGIDLARLLCGRSRSADARALLLPIYAEFTEGFATRDLTEAAALIAATGS